MTIHLRSALAGIVLLVVVVLIAAAIAAATGLYNVAADAPDSALVRTAIAYARENSIETRAASVRVPPLGDAHRIADGASDYDAMCTICHLAPGMAENEMRPGLDPKPPQLAALPRGDAAEQFWIIKHGIKMTGMPAWGRTHSDAEIWNMVAFLQKLPSLSPAQYRALVASSADHHDMDHMGH